MTTMSRSSPINIASPRRSASPPMSTLYYSDRDNYNDHDSYMSNTLGSSFTPCDPNFETDLENSFATFKPVPTLDASEEYRPRRESFAGNFAQGTSCGANTYGNWTLEDILMAGTSSFPYSSPSFHSSSYLRKFEEEFMRDFACCGSTIASLHDLLQHFEELHVNQQRPQVIRNSFTPQRSRENPMSNNKAETDLPTPSASPQLVTRDQSHLCTQTTRPGTCIGGIELMRQQQKYQSLPTTPMLDDSQSASDKMELDDHLHAMEIPSDPISHLHPVKNMRQANLARLPHLNLNTTALPYSAFRSSQPPTPASAGFSYQNNPTVSSVNTPTLSAHPMNYHQQLTPRTSGPGTPSGENDADFFNESMKSGSSSMSENIKNLGQPFPSGYDKFGGDYCIDEPGKRLYSPNGFSNLRIQRLAQLNQSQAGLGRTDAMLHAQQMQQSMSMGHAHNSSMIIESEEHKPYRCPVIGCEKAYKNQNGLKYHKTHGHNTQQLHENGDGTFSILNPETSAPYPGTLGMEKEKPYKCDFCSKRYKNGNGLKYHTQHSPPCNPNLNLNRHLSGLGPLRMNMSGLYGPGDMTGVMV